MVMMKTKKTPPPRPQECRSSRSRRRWSQSRTATAAIAGAALVITSLAWLSLVFSGGTGRSWFNKLTNVHLSANPSPEISFTLPPLAPPARPALAATNRSLIELDGNQKELTLDHIIFGIAGSSQLWNRRKEFVSLWWRPSMRGHVWLDEKPHQDEAAMNYSLPPIMVSEDTSRFRYTNPTGHPSGLRISRIISECFRLGLPDVRWFVLGDDDTIFNVDNLVAVLSKYDPSEMVYVGTPSESHSANTYFSHSMAYGGGGIAISYPLARALSQTQDECLERYPKFYGSDDRLHACISELGVPLTRELGFHQWDIRGSAYGLLTAHPIAPFISIHHLEAADPFYPGLSSLEGLKLFTKAMNFDPRSFLQRSICYDHSRRLTLSISLGYVVQVFPNIVYPRDLDRSELTFSAWNGIKHRNEFDVDTKDPIRSICKKPVLFFLKDVVLGDNGTTMGWYERAGQSNEMKRRVFCFPRLPPLHRVRRIEVLGHPLGKNWHLAPRRMCCSMEKNPTGGGAGVLRLTVRQCEKGGIINPTT